jgi:membrane protein
MSFPGLAGVGHRVRSSFPGRCLGSFLELQGIDRAMVLASQAFTALIPLLILASAFAPAGSQDAVANAIIRKFALAGEAASAVRTVFHHTGDGGTGTLSIVLLVFSGFSLTRRMQRMYLAAWRLAPLPGVRGSVNAGLGLAVLLVEMMLLALARTLVRGLPLDTVLGGLLSAVAGLVLWTSVPWLLLDRRVAWRRLLPAGLLASLCTSLYGVASTVYMPRLMTTYSLRYGLFGVTLALVGWLLAVAVIVVAATVVAAELDRTSDPWAQRVRAWFAPRGDGPRRAGPAQDV